MARDLFHNNVREALEKESWHITMTHFEFQ